MDAKRPRRIIRRGRDVAEAGCAGLYLLERYCRATIAPTATVIPFTETRPLAVTMVAEIDVHPRRMPFTLPSSVTRAIDESLVANRTSRVVRFTVRPSPRVPTMRNGVVAPTTTF